MATGFRDFLLESENPQERSFAATPPAHRY